MELKLLKKTIDGREYLLNGEHYLVRRPKPITSEIEISKIEDLGLPTLLGKGIALTFHPSNIEREIRKLISV